MHCQRENGCCVYVHRMHTALSHTMTTCTCIAHCNLLTHSERASARSLRLRENHAELQHQKPCNKVKRTAWGLPMTGWLEAYILNAKTRSATYRIAVWM